MLERSVSARQSRAAATAIVTLSSSQLATAFSPCARLVIPGTSHEIWEAMHACVKRGCEREGILPGGLKVKRRAAALYRKIKSDPDIYPAMIEDWLDHGRESRYALSPEEVVRRSDPRTEAEATAAAEFELGQYLHRAGDHAAAIPHWREAHRLYPDNWTYKRQAWNFEDPMRQGHTDAYDGSWYEDIKKIGAENYYPEIIP